MKISIFTCILNPSHWAFPYEEALRSWIALADEIIVIDGGSADGSLERIEKISKKIKIFVMSWPWEFKQREFPLHLNYGLEQCNGDWVIKFDIDFVLHEHDIMAFKQKLLGADNNYDIRVASFTRFNLLNRFEGIEKSAIPWIIHKKYTKDTVKFGVETDKQFMSDWSQPVMVEKYIDGVPYGRNPRIHPPSVLTIGNHVFNYDCFFRTKEKCKIFFQRAARAYMNETGIPLYGEDDNGAWELWKSIRRLQKKYTKTPLTIEDHPKVMHEKLRSMTPDMWGFQNWNWNL